MRILLLLLLISFLFGCIESNTSAVKNETADTYQQQPCIGCATPYNHEDEQRQSLEENLIQQNQTNESVLENETTKITGEQNSNRQNESSLNVTSIRNTTENLSACIGPKENEYDIYTQNEVRFRDRVYKDECVIATVVKKYYCKNDSVKGVNIECPPGYDCRNGACKPMDYICTKTSGNNITVKGHIIVVKGINTVLDEYDSCVDEGTVKEWMCAENGSGYYEELYCGTGYKCIEDEGRCTRSKCIETDDGDDPLHPGEITFANKNDTYKDSCIGDKTLIEYYCYGEGTKSREYTCKNKCDDNFCIPVYE